MDMLNTDGMKTEEVLEIAKNELEKKKLRYLVVASTTGDTGLKAAQLFKDFDVNLVVVAHSVGFKNPNENQFDTRAKDKMERMGASVIFSTMPFHTINDAIRKKSGSSTLTLIADALRMMGEGTKVCTEIVAIACDAGMFPSGEDVISVAGTSRGADTILQIRSANSRRFFDLKIIDVIAKPQKF